MNAKAMDAEPHCFVSGSLAGVLRLSRVAGIAPLRFVKQSTGWRISVSQGWNIYGYLMITFFNLAIAATLVSKLLIIPYKALEVRPNNTYRVVILVQLFLTTIIAGMAVYGASGQMRSMIACLNQVQKINSALRIEYSTIPLEKKKIGLLISWVTAILTLIIMDYAWSIYTASSINVIMWLSQSFAIYFCYYWIVELREIMFIMIALHVKNTFETINDRLRSLLNDLKNIPNNNEPVNGNMTFIRRSNHNKLSIELRKTLTGAVTNSKRYSNHETVQHLALEYAAACDVVRDVNRSHGPILMMMLGVLLVQLIFTPYFFITILLKDNTSNDPTHHVINVVFRMFWILAHVIDLVIIIEPCHLTYMEMETTRVLVSQLMSCTHSVYDPLAMELELFFKHLVLNECSYKPLGVTTMTRGLVITILGSITTYLVIIIQL